MRRFLLLCLLLLAIMGLYSVQGQYRCIPGEMYYRYSVPEGWNVIGMGCCGLVASDSTNPARGIIALNNLHGTGDLPAYTTPEGYLENYLSQDFSQGNNKVTDIRVLFDENDQNLAKAYSSYVGFMSSGKSMRCSFEVNGIPAEGSFTVVTNELAGYGTTIPFLIGGFAPADQFDEEAAELLAILSSIQFNYNYRGICGLIGGGSNSS